MSRDENGFDACPEPTCPLYGKAVMADHRHLPGRSGARRASGVVQEVERLCEVMHDAYESAAVREGWETQQRSRKPWSDVPEANKRTMRVAVLALLTDLSDHGRLDFRTYPGPLAKPSQTDGRSDA